MGRWAYFSTGFEYKFGFGVQDSEDITLFGGADSDSDYANDNDYNDHDGLSLIRWNEQDRAVAALRLDVMCQQYTDLPAVDVNRYLLTVDGTNSLYEDLWSQFGLMDENPIHYRYVLGCLILHQLMYADVLVCEYEN
jgi:hypothetical protein